MEVGLIWILMMSCSTEQSVQRKADILEQVEARPLEAKMLCGTFSESAQREFCIEFALQALPKDDVVSIRELCPELNGNARGECWFQVAERSLSLEDCAKATPFVDNCHMHITLKRLLEFEPTTWEEIEKIARQYGTDPDSTSHGYALYQYWFRNTSKLKLSDCEILSRPQICHDALASLYFHRLKEWDMDGNAPCQPVPDKIWHSDQPLFKTGFDQVYQRKCGDKIEQ